MIAYTHGGGGGNVASIRKMYANKLYLSHAKIKLDNNFDKRL